MDNISTSSEKEEELTRDEPEKWVPVKKPKSNEKSQKGPKIIHERSVSWEDVDLSEKENDVPDNRNKMKKYFKIIGAALLVLGVLIGVILSLVSFFGPANQTIFGAKISEKGIILILNSIRPLLFELYKPSLTSESVNFLTVSRKIILQAGAVHKLCRLKIGDFWSPLSCLFTG